MRITGVTSRAVVHVFMLFCDVTARFEPPRYMVVASADQEARN